jgi:hypothetical protein
VRVYETLGELEGLPEEAQEFADYPLAEARDALEQKIAASSDASATNRLKAVRNRVVSELVFTRVYAQVQAQVPSGERLVDVDFLINTFGWLTRFISFMFWKTPLAFLFRRLGFKNPYKTFVAITAPVQAHPPTDVDIAASEG